MKETKLLTVKQVAEHLQVTVMTVYRWIWAGTLPSVRVGRLQRIREQDLPNHKRSEQDDTADD